ncbi:hypothetical protein GQ43DRAFT_303267 [Delitschia confertaspora ATCC 74209]|uniref:Uncharacterized protein n=1 Tax=Delitschia confertaspora ATCC 74209 TaxID=1513339 RepID=A0A9P4JQS2_9PLEO|nr:hypothetical protein GQ43DRAFT_303267 [Delitschia confertaspora ATCC 74209]
MVATVIVNLSRCCHQLIKVLSSTYQGAVVSFVYQSRPLSRCSHGGLAYEDCLKKLELTEYQLHGTNTGIVNISVPAPSCTELFAQKNSRIRHIGRAVIVTADQLLSYGRVYARFMTSMVGLLFLFHVLLLRLSHILPPPFMQTLCCIGPGISVYSTALSLCVLAEGNLFFRAKIDIPSLPNTLPFSR